MKGRWPIALSIAALVVSALGFTSLSGAAFTSSKQRAASPLAVNTKLFAYVNEPDEQYHGIWIKDANGALVAHLDPGTYEIDVDDRSATDNFHLKGPGVDIKTAAAEIVHTTWTLTFTDGTYDYVSDFFPKEMVGLFSVGNPAPPPPPPPPAKCVVPKVVGKSLAKAKRKLGASHCRTGSVRQGHSTLHRGLVYWQGRKAGARLAHGTKIALRVSLGR